MASDMIDRLRGLRSGVAVKAPVRAVAATPITLSGEQTVDGVALVTGDRVLVTGQSSSVDNGIYDVDTGVWVRAADFDGAGDIVAGTMLLVTEGTSYGATMWRLDAAGTPGEDSLTFSSGIWVADGAIGTAELAALCVTTAKIAAEAVTAAKLATDAVETLKIKDANVTAAKLATDAVETLKIKDANVTAAKLAADVITGQPSGSVSGASELLLAVSGVLKKATLETAVHEVVKLASGSIASPGGDGAQAVTGLGFTPRAVIVIAAKYTGSPLYGSFGWSTGGVGHLLFTNASGSQVASTALASVSGGGVAVLTSFDADGFTITWAGYTAEMRIAYLAIG